VALYVDDLIFTGNNRDMIEKFKLKMTKEFEMIDLGLMSYFLGLEVREENSGIFFIIRSICKRDFEEV
jgi:Reverse transcriptase (RNA-dependent DNA polymerase)